MTVLNVWFLVEESGALHVFMKAHFFLKNKFNLYFVIIPDFCFRVRKINEESHQRTTTKKSPDHNYTVAPVY